MWRFRVTIAGAETQQRILCVLLRYTSLSTTLSVAQQCFYGEFMPPATIIGASVDVLTTFGVSRQIVCSSPLCQMSLESVQAHGPRNA